MKYCDVRLVVYSIYKCYLQHCHNHQNSLHLSSLDWTVVRYHRPVDKDTTENVVVTYGETNIKMEISRHNIAKFVFDQIKDDKYIKSMPIIGS